MIYLAKLLDDLIFTYSTNKKIKLLVDYLQSRNGEERGYTISILTGRLTFNNIKKTQVLNVVKNHIDQFLFEQSYDYVGDLAETIALIWPEKNKSKKDINLKNIILDLKNNNNPEKVIEKYLNIFDSRQRWAFIKLILGGLRVGLSTKLVKKSIAKYGNKKLEEIENIWNGLEPPYNNLFLWLDGKGQYPSIDPSKVFHSFMLATSFDIKLIEHIKLKNNFYFEYKWDGIRVQLVCNQGNTIIYSRSGDNISKSFPEIKVNSKKLVILDGEMLVGKNFIPLPFNQLQKRINKKNPTKKIQTDIPAFVKIYDILYYNDEDLRSITLEKRRKKLEKWFLINKNNNLDISKLIKFYSEKNLKKIFKKFHYIEGLMLKKKSSPYLSGRRKGYWYKWKRDPKFIDTILMYAQRGHGKRSSFYSDYTLGVWSNNTVIPIAKAYSGYTHDELNKIDKFIRKNTIAKYGPVREVKKLLVVELAYDAAQISNRHKAGIALRFPRINRVRWDKPINEVLNLDAIKKDLSLLSNV